MKRLTLVDRVADMLARRAVPKDEKATPAPPRLAGDLNRCIDMAVGSDSEPAQVEILRQRAGRS